MTQLLPTNATSPPQIMEPEPVPSEMNLRQGASHLVLHQDKLTLSYIKDGSHQHQVSSIQANHKVPTRCEIFYYELSVLDPGEQCRIAIGFAPKDCDATRCPGWDKGSYGFHSDDGHKFCANRKGERYADPWSKGDTVGAGICMSRQEMFFTINGRKLPRAFEKVDAQNLFPTIGMHSRGEKVKINFGATPFEFDVDSLVAQWREEELQIIQERPAPQSCLHSLVRRFLVHYGYEDTWHALNDSSGYVVDEDQECSSIVKQQLQTLDLRKKVSKSLLAGDVSSAIELLHQHCPKALNAVENGVSPKSSDLGGSKSSLANNNSSYNRVWLNLHCQQYIELVRAGKVSEAVEYGNTNLKQYHYVNPEVRDIFATVAYENPEQSPLSELFSDARRERVADAVNGAILAMGTQDAMDEGYGNESSREIERTPLETVLKQIVAANEELVELGNNMGATFNLNEHLAYKNRHYGW